MSASETSARSAEGLAWAQSGSRDPDVEPLHWGLNRGASAGHSGPLCLRHRRPPTDSRRRWGAVGGVLATRFYVSVQDHYVIETPQDLARFDLRAMTRYMRKGTSCSSS